MSFATQKSVNTWLPLVSLVLVSSLLAPRVFADTNPEQSPIVVYKSPFCLCCKEWIKHLEQNGFEVTSENGFDTAEIKQQKGIPQGMQGCHTGVSRGEYVFEGHVPARLIRKFLANPPEKGIGLAVPGMPEGSPGMYRGKNFKPYNVFLIMQDGEYRLYETVNAPEKS